MGSTPSDRKIKWLLDPTTFLYCRAIFTSYMRVFLMLDIMPRCRLDFYVEREHVGLRRICGAGVSVTRGAASVMMFTYSTLLVTMCRNHITLLRETFLHRIIPFDSAIAFHKYVAWWALIFTGNT